MTTIDSPKNEEKNGRALFDREQPKQAVTLPPKKVLASRLVSTSSATTTRPTTNPILKSNSAITSTSQLKRRPSASLDNSTREKRPNMSQNVKPPVPKSSKGITQSEKIVQACISHYGPYFINDKKTDSPLRVALEYPGAVEPESFLLLKPVLKNTPAKAIDDDDEDKDEYNPITDIMRTSELIYDCYLLPEEQRLLGNQSDGIMRNLTKYRNRRNGTGFVQAVNDFNRVVRQLKDEGVFSKNAKEMGNPNYELACHILYQVYSHTVARQAEALNNYQAFSNNVYGEINPILVKEFISKTNMTSESVFMDMGCGIGNVVLQVAAQTGCEAYGIEIMETPCKFAKRQLKEYAARMKAWRLPTGKIHFRHGDFLDVAANDLYSTLKRADVLLVNNYAFDAATNQNLAQLFLDLKEGTKIISLKSFVPKNHKINQRTQYMPESILEVQKFEYFSEAVSWTNNGGMYYIATVDRTRLKSYCETSSRYGRSSRSASSSTNSD
ncbi:DOT1-domain-containing protein [Backusella circina FSU 941]|nr:DOT1-domain-containing protein [Backusella circina FSU 941]